MYIIKNGIMITKENKKITSYNIFIKDSFNIIYNRESLNILPDYLKKDIYRYKNKKANIVIVELAKIWMDKGNYIIKHKYKMLDNKNIFLTNKIYNSIILYNNMLNMDSNIIYRECIKEPNKIILRKKINLFNIIYFSFITFKNSLCL